MTKTKPLRPFFPYYGSKWNMARYYPAPRHETVIEPFAGSAGYSIYYNPAKVLLVDKDPIIAGIWNYLIKATEQEVMNLPEMLTTGDSVDNYSLPQEAKWLIGFWLNRGSATPKKSRTAYSSRTDKAQLNWGLKAKQRVATQIRHIRHWQVMQGDYSILPDVKATWFIDPPYVVKGAYYRVGFKDYTSLTQWTQERKGQVIACEGEKADWLGFKPLGNFKTSKGHAKEYVFCQ